MSLSRLSDLRLETAEALNRAKEARGSAAATEELRKRVTALRQELRKFLPDHPGLDEIVSAAKLTGKVEAQYSKAKRDVTEVEVKGREISSMRKKVSEHSRALLGLLKEGDAKRKQLGSWTHPHVQEIAQEMKTHVAALERLGSDPVYTYVTDAAQQSVASRLKRARVFISPPQKRAPQKRQRKAGAGGTKQAPKRAKKK